MLIRFVLGHVAARAWLISNRCSMPVRPGADAFCSDPQRSAVQRQLPSPITTEGAFTNARSPLHTGAGALRGRSTVDFARSGPFIAAINFFNFTLLATTDRLFVKPGY